MEYVIITDATCDLSPELLNTHGIEIIPMDYIVADETYTWDGAHKDRTLLHSFYEHLRKDKSPTSTSQIPPNRYYDAFEPHVKEGRGIIYIALSSGVSNTCESAMAAVNMLKESYEDISIAVIDSLSGSFGEGLLVEAALKNKSAGMGFEDNVSWLREHVMNVRTFPGVTVSTASTPSDSSVLSASDSAAVSAAVVSSVFDEHAASESAITAAAATV